MAQPKNQNTGADKLDTLGVQFKASMEEGLKSTASAETKGERLAHAERVKTLILEERKKLMDLALVDPLTKAYNRRYFDTAIETLIGRERRKKKVTEPISVLMFDLDHFKMINDTLGHPKGDEVLEKVVEIMKANLKRPTDVVSRYGGEEFVIILENTDEKGAAHVAERIRKAIEWVTDNSKKLPKVTVSIGHATFDPTKTDVNSASSLVKAADDAGYFSKKTGRNRVTAFSHDIPEKVKKIQEEEKAEKRKAQRAVDMGSRKETTVKNLNTEMDMESVISKIKKELPDLPKPLLAKALKKMAERMMDDEKNPEETGTDG